MADLDNYRNFNHLFHMFNDIEIHVFNLHTLSKLIHRQDKGIQLKRIGTGFFQFTGKTNPFPVP